MIWLGRFPIEKMIDQVLRICAGVTLSLVSIAQLSGCISIEADGPFPETLADTAVTATQDDPSHLPEKSFNAYFDEVVEFVKTFCGEDNVKSVTVSQTQDDNSVAASVECYPGASNQDSTQ